MIALFAAAWLFSVPARAAPAVTAEYARQVSTAQVRLAELEALVAEAELRIGQLEDVIRQQGKTQAQRLENLDQVNNEVVRLRGDLEVLQFKVTQLERSVTEQQIASERRQLHAEMRLAQIEKMLSLKAPPPPSDAQLGLSGEAVGSTAPAPGATGTAPGAAAGGTAENVPAPASAADALRTAAGHLAAGHPTVARAILGAAIQQYPGDAQMDEIRYRYAETWFNEKDWKTAINEFNKVINNHPNSPWKCWALYRQGEALEALGKPDTAKAFYKGAVEGTCKSSDAAREAKKKL